MISLKCSDDVEMGSNQRGIRMKQQMHWRLQRSARRISRLIAGKAKPWPAASFMGLPTELRLQIYNYLFDEVFGEHHIRLWFLSDCCRDYEHPNDKLEKRMPHASAILTVNWTIFAEAIQVLFERTELHFYPSVPMDAAFDSHRNLIPPYAFQYIRTMKLTFDWTRLPGGDHGIECLNQWMADCGKFIAEELPKLDLLKAHLLEGQRMAMSKVWLQSEVLSSLTVLLEHSKLTKFALDVKPCGSRRNGLPTWAHEVVEEWAAEHPSRQIVTGRVGEAITQDR